jgi:hypothetical protein
MMSVGGGGFGGSGLEYPSETLQLWGGKLESKPIATPAAPSVARDDGSGRHEYAIIAVGAQGARTDASPKVIAKGLATLEWGSVRGADSYVIVRDGREIAGPLRVEGQLKSWTDRTGK